MALRILVTTDNHVGYNEEDFVRGKDAINAFTEAIQVGVDEQVDFMLQGGDLFHTNKPSKLSMYEVMHTLRKACLSDKPVEFNVVNHGPLSLPSAPELDKPNFYDPNFNVGIPFFCISGNHDDAGGNMQLMSPLDVLSMSGLVNHFGRVSDSTNIVIKPILIEKGDIKVALYGLASVRDERLFRTFRENKVTFLRPKTRPEEWYNIFVVHQNHVKHGPTNYLPEEFLPNFLDLIIWGHEHECLIEPQYNATKNFFVMQPGSTVQTSLSESETILKHCAVISIGSNKSFTCQKFPLKSARPFAMGTVVLDSDAPQIAPNSKDTRQEVTDFLTSEVNNLIEEAKRRYGEIHNLESPLPLVRLRVDFTGEYEVENVARFSKRFVDKVANTTDILHYFKRRNTKRIMAKHASVPKNVREGGIKQVGDLVQNYLNTKELSVLVGKDVVASLQRFVDKNESNAIEASVKKNIAKRVELEINANAPSASSEDEDEIDNENEIDNEIDNENEIENEIEDEQGKRIELDRSMDVDEESQDLFVDNRSVPESLETAQPDPLSMHSDSSGVFSSD